MGTKLATLVAEALAVTVTRARPLCLLFVQHSGLVDGHVGHGPSVDSRSLKAHEYPQSS